MKLFNYKVQICILITLCALDIGGTAYLVQWRETFWQSVSDKHFHEFIKLLLIFTGVALGLCAVYGMETYIQCKIALNWRRVLTRKAWLVPNLRDIEGHQQRVQQDCLDYPMLILDLIRYFGMQSILIVYFLVVIVHQIGGLQSIVPLVYSAISTGIGYYIAYPLIHLNYINQVLEAAFRQSLTKRDYGKVHRNNHKLFRKTKHITYFQSFYSQVSIIFPYLLLSTSYFTGKIAFGVFMQIASTIGSLTDSLGAVVGRFDQINKFLSCRKRLKELAII